MSMKLSLIKLGIILLLISALSSCRKAVNNIKLSRTDDAAIMQGFLNPGADTVTISLAVASGVTKNKKAIYFEDLKNARVSIESNGTVKNLVFLREVGTGVALFYIMRSDMNLQAGATYTVQAVNEGKFALKASTTIPEANTDFSFEVNGPFSSATQMPFYRIKTHISDRKGIENYYRVSIISPPPTMPYDEFYSRNYTTDEHDALSSVLVTVELEEETYRRGGNKIAVSNISEEYYKFVQSVSTAESTGGNPFAEPTTLYTNVSGGLGVIASMTVSYKDI